MWTTNGVQSRDPSNPNMKYTTITAFDDDRAPIGVTDHKSKIDQSDNKEVWFFRQDTGQLDVNLNYYQGPFAKNIGGKVSFPWGKHYTDGSSKCIESHVLSFNWLVRRLTLFCAPDTLDLEQKAEYTYTNKDGIEHRK